MSHDDRIVKSEGMFKPKVGRTRRPQEVYGDVEPVYAPVDKNSNLGKAPAPQEAPKQQEVPRQIRIVEPEPLEEIPVKDDLLDALEDVAYFLKKDPSRRLLDQNGNRITSFKIETVVTEEIKFA